MIGESSFAQRGVEKITGAVAGKHAACAISAVRGRSEAENQELSLRVTESGDGLAPIFTFAIRATLFARDLLTVFHEARAFAAGDNFFIQDAKLGGIVGHAF